MTDNDAQVFAENQLTQETASSIYEPLEEALEFPCWRLFCFPYC